MELRWTLLIAAVGAAIVLTSIPKPKPPPTPIDLSLRDQLPPAPAVADTQFLVRVFDQAGAPLPLVSVSWHEDGSPRTRSVHTLTNEDGQAWFSAGGTVFVSVPDEALPAKEGVSPVALGGGLGDRFRLSPREPSLDFFIHRTCPRTIQTVDRRGEPVEGVGVLAVGGRGWHGDTLTDDGGLATLHGAPCKEVTAFLSGLSHGGEAIAMAADQEAATVTLHPGRAVLLQATGRGLPLERFSVGRPVGIGQGTSSGGVVLQVDAVEGDSFTVGAVGYHSEDIVLPPSGPDRVTVALEPDGSAGFTAYRTNDHGFLVSAVDPHGIAAEAGLMRGDIIRHASVAGLSARSWSERLLDDLPDWLPVTLEVERGDERVTLRW